nr:ABC transporter substrate-binding protein [Microvirga antarctica]
MTNRRGFLGVCATLVACGFAWTNPAAAQPAKDITVVFPSPGGVGYYPFYVAIGEGYFDKEGLRVRPESVNGSGQVLQMLAAGQAQIGHPGPGPLLAARAAGLDMVFLYNNFAKSQFGLVVKDDSAFKIPDQLKGKKIGVGTADGAEVAFVRAILDDLKMKEGTDYEFLTVGDGGMATAAFMRGDIDAYASGTRDAAILRLRGVPLREITPDKFLAYFGNGYVTTRDFIKKDPEALKGFGRALAKASVFAADPANKAKVLEHAKIGNPQEGEDKAFSGALFEAMKGRVTPADLSNGWGYHHPEQWKLWHAALLASGALKAPLPDLENAYTNQFVKDWNAGIAQ